VVAGLFAGATTWATHVDPLHSKGAGSPGGTAAQSTSDPSATTDPAIVALRRQLAAQQRAMNKLAAQVTAVRAKATALAKQNGASASGSTTTRYAGSSSAGTSARSSGSSRSSGVSSPNKQAPKPAPAPTTQGSTGASGSP
jgi:uncharacterized coiled-coil protein SlyX